MVERVGVEVDPLNAAGEDALDGTVEQPRADAAADVGERQAEEDELVAAQLEIADQIAVVLGDVQLVIRLVEQCLQSGIAQQAALIPQPGTADAIIEVAIEGSSRRGDALDLHGNLGRVAALRPVGAHHLQMCDGDRQAPVGARWWLM
jgi:hypothetical protein